MGKRRPKPKQGRIIKWSSKLAYAVGLITTDGCLSKDRRHIDFTSKDKDLVVKFRDCLGLKNKIGTKSSGSNSKKEYYRLQFGDVGLYNWLCVIGLSPHKSKTIADLNVPDEFFFDFLRGCFDGDGTIYSFWDKRWHSSYMFYLCFTSASLEHLEWLQELIEKNAGVLGRIKLGNRCYQLSFAKQATRIIWASMFYKDKLPYLQRKYIKAQNIFHTDTVHNLAVAK